jgi:hypothetical protein
MNRRVFLGTLGAAGATAQAGFGQTGAAGTPRCFILTNYLLKVGTQGTREAEMTILAKCGAAPILFATTVIGRDMPNLTWITAFEDEAARDKAWAAFGADPAWQKLSQESNKRYGPNPTVRQILLYRSTAHSPIK